MQTVNVNERIRDLDLTKDGSIIATTDSGKLLIISRKLLVNSP
jgi:glucose/arabinose dehydrogenase